jgi:hypothetical protein
LTPIRKHADLIFGNFLVLTERVFFLSFLSDAMSASKRAPNALESKLHQAILASKEVRESNALFPDNRRYSSVILVCVFWWDLYTAIHSSAV